MRQPLLTEYRVELRSDEGWTSDQAWPQRALADEDVRRRRARGEDRPLRISNGTRAAITKAASRLAEVRAQTGRFLRAEQMVGPALADVLDWHRLAFLYETERALVRELSTEVDVMSREEAMATFDTFEAQGA